MNSFSELLHQSPCDIIVCNKIGAVLMQFTSLIIMDPVHINDIFGPDQLEDIESMTTLLHPPMSEEEALARPDLLKKVNFLFAGWDSCCLDEAFLKSTPELKAVFYGAGSVLSLIHI